MAETAKQKLERLRTEQGALESSWWDKVEGFMRFVGQGVTFGFSDEITAGLRRIGSSLTYEELRDEERQKLETFREQFPGIALTGEVIGGLLIPGFGTAGTLGKLGVKGAQQVARHGGMGKLATAGAAEGGLYGAGVSEAEMQPWEDIDYGQAAQDIGIGAVTGGVASPLVGQATKMVGRRFRGITPAQRRAGKTIEKEFEVSDVSPDVYRSGPERLSGTDVLADAPVLQGAATQSLQAPGARYKSREILRGRLGEERGNVNAELHRLMNTWDDDADEVIEGLLLKLKQTAPQDYARAYSNTSINLRGLFSKNTAKDLRAFERQAYADARVVIDDWIAAAEKQPGIGWSEADRLPQSIDEFLKGGTATTRALHQIKKSMDDVAYGDNGTDAHKKLTQQFNEGIKKQNADYVTANKAHEIAHRQKDAVQLGKKYNLRTAAQIKSELAKLPEEAQMAYRSGMLKAVNEARPLERSSLADYLVGNTKIKQKLRAAFADDASFDEFIGGAERMGRQRETHKFLFGGSPTQPRQAMTSGPEATVTGAAQVAPYGAEVAVAGGLTAFFKNRAGRSKEETLEELNKLLFRHPGGPQKALDEAYRLASADERRYLAQMMSAGAARAGAGQTAGLLGPQ